VAWASTAAGAGRGRIGLAGELAGRLKRARKGKTGGGNLAHHVKKRRASSRAKRKQQRRVSTMAAALAALRQAGTQAPGAARLLWQLPLVNKHHVRAMIVHGEEKSKAAMHFTDDDVCTAAGRSRGGGAVKLVLGACVCALQRRKGGTGVRARAKIGPVEGRRGEMGGPRAAAPAIDGRGHHGSMLMEG
jgi:hypothetical protein